MSLPVYRLPKKAAPPSAAATRLGFEVWRPALEEVAEADWRRHPARLAGHVLAEFAAEAMLQHSAPAVSDRMLPILRRRARDSEGVIVVVETTNEDRLEVAAAARALSADIRAMKKADYEALKQFAKGTFDGNTVVNAAQELLFTRGIVATLHNEFASPSEDFVRYLAKGVYTGVLGKSAKELFTTIVKRAQQQFLTEFFTKFSATVTSAINRPEPVPAPATTIVPPASAAAAAAPVPPAPDPVGADEDEIITTAEEREGFDIVKAIMSSVVEPARVVMRDTKSYCGILLDDNNRKPIVRLRFNTVQKSIGVFDAMKNEERIPIAQVSDIYQHADRIRATAQFYRQPATA